MPRVAHRQGLAVLVEHRLSQLLCLLARLRRGGGSCVWRRLGDVVVNQVGRRLDMVFRRWLRRWLLLESQEGGINDRLVVDSQRLRDDILGLQINAQQSSILK